MTLLELALVLLLSVISLWVLLHAWQKSAAEIFSPRVFFTALIVYYTVLGPLYFLWSGQGEAVGVYIRPIFWEGWLASLVAYVAFLVGYGLRRSRPDRVSIIADDRAGFMVSGVLFGIAAIAMVYWVVRFGGGIRFLRPTYSAEAEELSSRGLDSPLAVYLLQLINLTFGAVCLLMLYVIERRSLKATALLFGILTFSVLFFIKSGFRYRFAWMAVGMTVSYYLWKKRHPPLWLWTPLFALFLLTMGFIGETRNYFGGLSLERASGTSIEALVGSAFSESGTFFTTCQIVDTIPRRMEHTWFDPIWVAITYPVPRAWWPGKPISKTLDTIAQSFGTDEALSAGMSQPYYAEWYVAFGWFGVIFSSVLFGYGSRRLWDWYLERDRDKLALVIYAVGLGFIYVAFSRGFLAQAVLNFSFALLPLMLIYRAIPKTHFYRPSSGGTGGGDPRRTRPATAMHPRGYGQR